MNDLKKGRVWNSFMIGVFFINIFILFNYYNNNFKNNDSFQKKLTILVSIYVLVCGIRGIFPRIEDSKLCFYNNYISMPLIGRSLATIAELSFTLQFVLITQKILKYVSKFIQHASILQNINSMLFPLIAIAQFSCWVGIITTDTSWNAIEESIWTLFGLAKILIYIFIYCGIKNITNNKKINHIKYLAIPLILGVVVYTLFMISVDVPMYVKKAKKHNGKYLGFFEGLKQLTKCKITTMSYKRWKEEIPWLTSYFTFAVWFSLALLFWYNSFSKL